MYFPEKCQQNRLTAFLIMERQFLFKVKIVKEENEAPNLFFEIFKF